MLPMARFAITDIHGCTLTFKALVQEQLKLKKEDELYILGDLVNKGPDSKGVLDYIKLLQESSYKIRCLRGNHDQMLIDAYHKGDKATNLTPEEKALTLQSFGIDAYNELPKEYYNFLDKLEFYIQLPDYLLVHAGFDFNSKDIFKNKEAMLNIRDYKVDNNVMKGKRLLHGHTPTALYSIKKALKHKDQCINLDAGCVYYKNAPFGNLVALNMDTMKLYVQNNIDKPYTGGRKG
jgi:serine/threonine protein phosphatase 1